MNWWRRLWPGRHDHIDDDLSDTIDERSADICRIARNLERLSAKTLDEVHRGG